MINAIITSLSGLIYQLTLYQLLAEKHTMEEHLLIHSDVKYQLEGWLKIAEIVANDFEIKAVDDRIAVVRKKIEKGLTNRDLGVECRVLRETIDAGLKWQFIYRYSDESAAMLKNWQEDWKPVIAKFPSTEKDAFAAVDCWALGHGTAAVFHAMRILEHGLAALARELGKDIGVQNWQNVIDQIESEIRGLGKSLRSGSAKSERLHFLSEAAKEIVYFKDGWRNYVSHNRSTYDAHQARSAIDHVRAFMTALSRQLSEVQQSR